jgi:hypothetical protein
LLSCENQLEAMATTGYTPLLSNGVGYGVVVSLGVVFALGMVTRPLCLKIIKWAHSSGNQVGVTKILKKSFSEDSQNH